MKADWTVTLGQMLPYIVAFGLFVGGAALAWFVNKVKDKVIVEMSAMFATFKTTFEMAIAEAVKKVNDRIDDEVRDLKAQIADTNGRLTQLAAGVSEHKAELHTFKEHVERHYVEKDELAELKSSIDKSLNRIETGFERATATMDDVRDSVIALTSVRGKTTVPPKRRAAVKSVEA